MYCQCPKLCGIGPRGMFWSLGFSGLANHLNAKGLSRGAIATEILGYGVGDLSPVMPWLFPVACGGWFA